MVDHTNIEWTDSTFNPWWGCTKVAPGCDHCYAAALDKRTGGNHWETEPKTLSDNYWQQPHKWNRRALANHKKRKVFCGSMCDVFDNNAPKGQRERLWKTIKTTPMLDWQLLTKRASNIEKYLPDDWENGYSNVWLGVTVENKQHGIPRLKKLQSIPTTLRFLSIEPLLEDLGKIDLTGIHWVIVGGETGIYSRTMKLEWVLNIKEQCQQKEIPFFFKQWGGRRDKGGCLLDGHEVKEWPETIDLTNNL